MANPVPIINLRDSYADRAKPTGNFSSLSRFKLAGTGSNTEKYAYLFGGMPFPKGSTLTTGLMRVWNSAAISGTVTITAEAIAATWTVGRLNWNNKPAVLAGTPVTLTKTNAAANTLWELNIKPLLDFVATGGAWYGIRLTITGTAVKTFHSTQSEVVAMRPQFLVEWQLPPNPPTNLAPDGGRFVAKTKPLLTYLFTDPGGDVNLIAQQIQVSTSTDFTTPLYNPGWTDTTTSQYDLNAPPTGAPAFTAMTEGQVLYWRVKVRDGSGLESGWSAIASFAYSARGAMTFGNTFGTRVVTNLIPNPSVETNTTNIAAAGTGVTISRDTVEKYAGTASLKVVCDGLSANQGGQFVTLPGSTFGNGAKSAAVMVKGPVGATAYGVLRTIAQTTGTVTDKNTASFTFTGDWQRILIENQTPGAAVNTQVAVMIRTLPAQAITFWMDLAVAVEGATAPSNNFDGDTVAGLTAYSYAWTGTPHASTSTQTLYYVEDTSPPVNWTLAGPRLQSKYQVIIYDVTAPNIMLYDSGMITSTTAAASTNGSMMNDITHDHMLQIWLWDDRPRQANGGDPVPQKIERVFRYSPGTSVTPFSNFTVEPELPWPWAILKFDRATLPDSITILRDDIPIETNLDPYSVFKSGISYWYYDRAAPPRIPHVWKVIANQNNVDSQPAVSASLTTKSSVTWMMNLDGSNPICLVKSASRPTPAVDAQSATSQEVHQPIGGGSPVLITQFMAGFEGHCEAVLTDDVAPGLTARQMRDRFKAWKKAAGTVLYLYMVDEVLKIVPYNMSYRPRAKSGGQVIYDITFDFFEAE